VRGDAQEQGGHQGGPETALDGRAGGGTDETSPRRPEGGHSPGIASPPMTLKLTALL